jgi:hypothetical protein
VRLDRDLRCRVAPHGGIVDTDGVVSFDWRWAAELRWCRRVWHRCTLNKASEAGLSSRSAVDVVRRHRPIAWFWSGTFGCDSRRGGGPPHRNAERRTPSPPEGSSRRAR